MHFPANNQFGMDIKCIDRENTTDGKLGNYREPDSNNRCKTQCTWHFVPVINECWRSLNLSTHCERNLVSFAKIDFPGKIRFRKVVEKTARFEEH